MSVVDTWTRLFLETSESSTVTLVLFEGSRKNTFSENNPTLLLSLLTFPFPLSFLPSLFLSIYFGIKLNIMYIESGLKSTQILSSCNICK